MKADTQRIDRFAELLSQGKDMVEIRALMRITNGTAQGLMSRLRKSLGPQAV